MISSSWRRSNLNRDTTSDALLHLDRSTRAEQADARGEIPFTCLEKGAKRSRRRFEWCRWAEIRLVKHGCTDFIRICRDWRSREVKSISLRFSMNISTSRKHFAVHFSSFRIDSVRWKIVRRKTKMRIVFLRESFRFHRPARRATHIRPGKHRTEQINAHSLSHRSAIVNR